MGCGLNLTNYASLDLLSFFHDRLKVYLRDQGVRHDLIDAVLMQASPPSALSGISPARGEIDQADDLLIISQKASALQKLADSEDGKNLLAGYKRAANILAAEEKKGTAIAETVSENLLKVNAEIALNKAIGEAENKASSAIASEDFEGCDGSTCNPSHSGGYIL